MLRLFFSLSLIIARLAAARSSSGGTVLVVQDPTLISTDHSLFWNSLEARGYSLTFRSSKAAGPLLVEYDEPLFDHLILFAPAAKSLPSDLSPQSLYDFVEKGKNVLVVLSPDLSELWRDFSREFEVDFDERNNMVVDHFHYDQDLDNKSHTALVIPLSDALSPIVSALTRSGAPLLYRGVGHQVGRLPLLNSILSATSTAYSWEVKEADSPTEDVFIAGSSIGLVTALQAKNNARVTFIGSLEVFSNEFGLASVKSSEGMQYAQSGNVAFIKDVTSWTFQESGVIKVTNVSHSRAIDHTSMELYRVGDELTFEMDLSSFDGEKWGPHVMDDLQLDVTMLDPYLRIAMSPVLTGPDNTTRFSSQFRAPDKHGVFTLRVDYRRSGWSYIKEESVVSITPPRHDEYPRFIGGATPYYLGALSVSVATLIFVTIWTLQ